MLTRQQVVESCKRDYKLSGITIRYFSYLQDKGLLPVGIQDKLHRRVILFPDNTPAIIALIKQLQDKESLTLRQIKDLFDNQEQSQTYKLLNALGLKYREGITRPFVFTNDGEPYDIIAVNNGKMLHCYLVEQFQLDMIPENLRIIKKKSLKLTANNILKFHKNPHDIFGK